MATYNPINRVIDDSGSINIQGVAFSSINVDIRMMGRKVGYIKSLSWDSDTEMGYDVAGGAVASIFGEGSAKNTGSMELGLSEYKKLTDSAMLVDPVNHKVTNLPAFDIIITNYDPMASARKTTLKNVKFKKVSGDQYKEGDLYSYKSLDFIFSDYSER
jgi:hypothetical protein